MGAKTEAKNWWQRRDLNPRPKAYESSDQLRLLNNLGVTEISELSKLSKAYISQVKHGSRPPSQKLLEILISSALVFISVSLFRNSVIGVPKNKRFGFCAAEVTFACFVTSGTGIKKEPHVRWISAPQQLSTPTRLG